MIENCEKKLYQAESRISELLEAIRPLVAIADAYDAEELDEARPSWMATRVGHSETVKLYSGRGGRCLITLEDTFKARDVATGKIHTRPGVSEEVAKAIVIYNAGLPNMPWNEMPEERRQAILSNYKNRGII